MKNVLICFIILLNCNCILKAENAKIAEINGKWILNDNLLTIYINDAGDSDVLIDDRTTSLPFLRQKADLKEDLPAMQDGFYPPVSITQHNMQNQSVIKDNTLMMWISSKKPNCSWTIKVPDDAVQLLKKNPDAMLVYAKVSGYKISNFDGLKSVMIKQYFNITLFRKSEETHSIKN